MNNPIERDLRLKGHIYFNKVEEGVYFQGQTGGFIVKGDKIYPLVAKIISFIDAGYRLQDIQSQLPEKLRPFYENLIGQLNDHHMLVERDAEKSVPEAWLNYKQFRDFFTYLQENAADFQAQFAQWQAQKVLVFGEGYALKSAVEALANSGLNELAIAVTNEDSVSVKELKNTLDFYGQQLPGFTYQIKSAAEFDPAGCSSFDFIAQCTSQLDTGFEVISDVPGIVAGVLFGQAVVSPLSSVSHSGYSDLEEQLLRTAENADIEFPKAGLSMLGSIAALNLIKGFFGIEVDSIRNYVYRVSRHLEVSRHPLFPINTGEGDAQMIEDFQTEYEMPDDRELEKYEQVKLALSAFFDPLLGCLDESVGDTIKQVPLFHAKLQVKFPASKQAPAKEVMSCGLDASTAGLRAIGEALSIRTSVNQGVPHQVVTTGFDYDEWRQKAAAIALANTKDFISTLNAAQLNLLHLEDEEMQLIIRFLMSAGYPKQSLQLYWNSENTCFIARLPYLSGETLDRRRMVASIAANALDAIKDCLCATYMRLQFPDTDLLPTQGEALLLPEPEVIDESGELLRQVCAVAAGTLPVMVYEQGEQILTSHGIYSGYATLESEEVA